MAKKIYVCDDIYAKDVRYKSSAAKPLKADNVQDAIDEMCDILNNKVKDKHYFHIQLEASREWHIEHGLGKSTSVFLEDWDGNDMEGDVEYVDDNNIIIYFSAVVDGKAILN